MSSTEETDDLVSKPAWAETSAELAFLYSDVYRLHDEGDFRHLQEKSVRILQLLGTSTHLASRAAEIATRIYKVSDDADSLLSQNDLQSHRNIFNLIYEDARALDKLLGLTKGSFSHEITWWYYFRLTFSKKNNPFEKIFYLSVTFLAVLREHLARLRKPKTSFLCTLYLGLAGLAHEKRNRNRERRFLELYWQERIAAESGRLSSNLYMI